MYMQNKIMPTLTGALCLMAAGSLAAVPLKPLLDDSVWEAPKMEFAPELDQRSTRALFFEAMPYKGKPTKVFAYIGIPKSDKPVPAMVLVHGGGGTAFSEWVKIWNDRGYAAIAMDLEGNINKAANKKKQRHADGGPKRPGIFKDAALPMQKQWMYHAVSDVVLAHSLLASMEGVDADRIGITGISWGGILSSLVSGVDDRLKCAIPIYGCGYLYDSKGNFNDIMDSSAELLVQKKFWDPANQFSTGSVPTLWINGDSDGHFSVDITSRSFQRTADHAFMSIHPGLGHNHYIGWDPVKVPESYVFADQVLKGKKPGLGRITKQPERRIVKLEFESAVPITEATVYYLDEALTYRKKNPKAKHSQPGPWLKMAARMSSKKKIAWAKLPATARTYYVNLKDERGCIISSEVIELD